MSKPRREKKPRAREAPPTPGDGRAASAAHAVRPSASPPEGPSSWPHRLALAGLLCALVLVAYTPALRGGFIWDDKPLLSDSALVRAPDGLRRFWLTAEAPDYWPLTSTTFWLEWRLWGMDPTGYHVTNVALHAACALLAWALLARLGVPGAYLGALLFAVHPVNVESVAWIAQRKNLVALVFFLPSVLLYLSSDERGRARPGAGGDARYWASLGLFVLAMLGKGSVATLPAILLLLIWWRRGALSPRDLARVVPFGVAACGLVLVNVWFQTHGTGPLRDVGWLDRLLGAGAVVWFYLSKALLPVGLSFVYPQWSVSAARPAWWIPGLAAALATVVLWRMRAGRARPFFVAWVFYLLALVPVMGLTDVYFMKYSLVADHYQHVALLGATALVAAGAITLHGRLAGAARRGAVAVAALAVAALTLASARQSAAYRDEETLWRAASAANPDAWLAHYNLAVDLAGRDRRAEAMGHLEAALRAKPDYAEAHNNLALLLSAGGRDAEALEHAQIAVRLRPDMPEARVSLGILLAKGGRPADALPHLEEAVRIRPASAEAQHNLGLVLAALGRPGEALPHQEEAARLDPGSAEAQEALGTALLAAGRPQDACAALEAALRLRPGRGETLANLGLALLRSGRPEEAMARYAEALRASPDLPDAQYNVGTLFAMAGRPAEAEEHYAAALRLRPDYAEAHNNLAAVLVGAGRLAEARAHLEAAVRLKPDLFDARANLADVYARSGRRADALAQARAALALAPPSARPPLEQRIRAWGGRL
ncbi:MAG: tetratricopeptide repeat protein [Vicinamibacteria bacterium]